MRQSPDTQKPIFQVLADGLDASVDGRGWTAEHEAAKNLANTAPELLEALKDALSAILYPVTHHPDRLEIAAKAQAIIAKAEGRHV